MENNINSNNNNNFMKKILSLIMLSFLLMLSVNGATIIYNQDEVIEDFENYQYNTKISDIVLGSNDNEVIGTQIGDYKLELKDITNDVYLIFGNNYLNNSINLTWFNTNGNETIATTQEVILNEIGDYYFKIQRNYNNDNTDILIDTNYLQVANIYVVFAEREYVEDSETNIFSTLVVYVIELLIINITIWKVGFYLGLGVIGIGSIVLLVLWAYRFYTWAQSQDIFNTKQKSNTRK